jgi:hypothetical protein
LYNLEFRVNFFFKKKKKNQNFIIRLSRFKCDFIYKFSERIDLKYKINTNKLYSASKIVFFACLMPYGRTPKYIYKGKVTFEFFTNSCTQGFFIRSVRLTFDYAIFLRFFL